MTGRTVAHYRIGDKLGEGGSSVVYRAVDQALGREVVLKMFVTEGAAGLARLLHEARTISSLNHPNICTIYEIGQHEGRHFLAMEWLDGQVLSEVINGRPLTIDRVIDFGSQTADALDAAHAALVVHRDLKPANIFVTRAGRIKLLDFGVAALLVPRSDARKAALSLSSTAGTVPYMSPEQARADELDHRTDLFSLGSVLYEMATGRRPFAGRTAADVRSAIVSHAPPPARTLNHAVPLELDRIIGKALEKDPAFRYQTALDVRADLQRLKRDLADARRTDDANGHSRALRRGRPSRTLRVVAMTGAPAVIAVAWLVAAAMERRHHVVPKGESSETNVQSSDVLLPIERAEPSRPAAVIAMRPRDVTVPAPSRRPDAPRRDDASGALRETSRAAPPTPLPAVDPAPSAALDPLVVARQQIELKLFDQAIETLRPVAQGPDRQQAIDAAFLMASIHDRRGDVANAMGKYVEIATRFADDPRAAEALFRLAQSTMTSKRREKEREAGQTLTNLVQKYPASPVAAQALLLRGDIEARQGAYQRDDLLGGSIPTAAITYREVVGRYPSTEAAAAALAKLARLYADGRRFETAADTFEQLAERDATDRYDAWFEAANLLDKHLKDKVRARAAYARVPPSSPHYTEAQRRLRP